MNLRVAIGILLVSVLAFAFACGGDSDADEDGSTPASDADQNGQTAGLGEPGLDSPTISLGSTTIAAGETGEVVLDVLNFEAPGLGAWTFDVSYDASMLTLISCDPQTESSVCNPDFDDDKARIVGATGTGFEGDTEISLLTFQCEEPGESALELSVQTLADGTIGDPQLVAAHVEGGSITCSE